MRTGRNLAGIVLGVPLVMTAAGAAEVQLSAVAKPIDGFEAFVSMIVNVYAVFDGTDQAANFLTAVGGLPSEGAHVRIVGGQFFSHPANPHEHGRLAPPYERLPMVPGLAADSFLTIGAKAGGSPTVPIDVTSLTHGFPREDGIRVPGGVWTPTELTIDDGAWFVTPDDPQGHVGMADNGIDSVLIGQFSVAAGTGRHPRVEGHLRVQGVNQGTPFVSMLGFAIPAPATLAVAALAIWPTRRRGRG